MTLKLVTLDGKETTLSGILADGRNFPVGKFVVVKKENEQYVCLFSSNILHSDAAKHLCVLLSGTFVAAGKREWTYTRYDSSSCTEEYGYDRPKDPEEARQLLEELKTIFLQK